MSEFRLITALNRVLAQASPEVIVGIGDDAAVLREGSGSIVWTIDAQVEGVHFRREWLSWADVGYRSMMAAASDLAAMGAMPTGALSALTVSDDVSEAMILEVSEGQREAAGLLGCPVIGGNVSRGGTFSVTMTVLGRAAKPLLRSNARPGDLVQVAGRLGDAALGLTHLMGGSRAGAGIAAWRRPHAQIEAGLRAHASATAAIDVSDGLGQDVEHLARASGVRVVLVEAQLLKCAPRLDPSDALALALWGGEDYALVVSAPSSIEGFEVIGTVTEGNGVLVKHVDGCEVEAASLGRGYDHGLRERA